MGPPYLDILEIPTRHFAQQITAMDNVSVFFIALKSFSIRKLEVFTLYLIVRKVMSSSFPLNGVKSKDCHFRLI